MIFVDTTFWVGDADASDTFHDSAHAVLEALRTGATPLALTTDLVLNETVTILGQRRGFGADRARRAAEAILASPRVFVAYVDEGMFRESLRLFPGYGGRLSMTDVCSVVVMRRFRTREIFSHDRDFDIVEGIRRRETV